MGGRSVVHVDVDAFFVQVECHRNPLLQPSMPLAVQQHQDIIAVSYAARALGVKKHMAPQEVRRRFPAVTLVHVHTIGENNDKASYKYYRRASKAIHTILKGFCERCEKASIDEAFLEPSDLELPPPSDPACDSLVRAAKLAEAIQTTLTKNLQYSCSVGVARNKLLAKLASQRAKPSGIHVIDDSNVAEVLRTTDVYKLPGCGEYSRIGEALTRNGCKCIADVQQFNLQQLIELIGEKSAQQVYNWARGIDDDPVGVPVPPKSIVAQMALSPVQLPVYNRPGEFITPVYAYDVAAVTRFLRILAEEIVERMLDDEEEYKRHAGTIILVYSTDATHRTQRTCSSACPCFPAGCDVQFRVDAIVDVALDTFRRIQRAYENSVQGKRLNDDGGAETVDGFAIDVFKKPLTRLNITLTNFQDSSVVVQLSLKQFFAPAKIPPGKRKVDDAYPPAPSDETPYNGGDDSYDILAEKDSASSSYSAAKHDETISASAVTVVAPATPFDNLPHADTIAPTASPKRPRGSSGKQRSVFDKYFRPAGEVTDDMVASMVVCDVCKRVVAIEEWDEHRDYHVALQLAELPPTQPASALPTSRRTQAESEVRAAASRDYDTSPAPAPSPAAALATRPHQPDNIDIWLSRTQNKARGGVGFRFSEVLGNLRVAGEIRAFFEAHLSDK